MAPEKIISLTYQYNDLDFTGAQQTHFLKNGLNIVLYFMHPYLRNQLNLLIYSNQGSKRQVNVRQLYDKTGFEILQT